MGNGRLSPFSYKPIVVVPIALTVLGFIFFHIASYSCKTFLYDTGTAGIVKAGYWGFEGLNGCEKYIPPVDAVTKWGRSVGIMGSILAIPVLLLAGALLCTKVSRMALFGAAFACMTLAMLSFLLLSGQASGNELKQGPGGILAIFAAFLWTGAGVSFLKCVKEKESDSEKADREIVVGEDSNAVEVDSSSSTKKVGFLAALGLAGAGAAGGARAKKKGTQSDIDDGVDDGAEDRDIEAGETGEDAEVDTNGDGEKDGKATKKGIFAGLGLAGLAAGASRKKKSDKTGEAADDDGEDEDNDDAENGDRGIEAGAADGDEDGKNTGMGKKTKTGIFAGMGLAGLAAGASRKKKADKTGEPEDNEGVVAEDRDIEAGEDGENMNTGEDKGEKKAKKSMFGRKKKKADKSGEAPDDGGEEGVVAEDRDIEVENAREDETAGEDEKTGKKARNGMFAGMGLAGIAAGAASRKKKKSDTTGQDGDNDGEDGNVGEDRDIEAEENGATGEKTNKKEKKSLFGRKKKQADGTEEAADNDGAEDRGIEVEEDGITGEGEKTGKKAKNGMFAGMGLAGLAAGAASRKKKKSGATGDEDDDEDGDVAEDRDIEVDEDEATGGAKFSKKEKKGLFGRKKKADRSGGAADNDGNIAEDRDIEVEEDGITGEAEKSGKKAKSGMFAGMGLAGLAAGAASRKKKKTDGEAAEKDLEDDGVAEVDADNATRAIQDGGNIDEVNNAAASAGSDAGKDPEGLGSDENEDQGVEVGEADDGESGGKTAKKGMLAGLGLGGLAAGAGRKKKQAKKTNTAEDPVDILVDIGDEDIVHEDDDDDDGDENEASSWKNTNRGMFAGMGLAAAGAGASRKKKKEKGAAEVDEDGNDPEDDAGEEKNIDDEEDFVDDDQDSGTNKKRGILAGMGLAGLAAGAGGRRKKNKEKYSAEVDEEGDEPEDDEVPDGNGNKGEKEVERTKSRGMFGGGGSRRKKEKKVTVDDNADAGTEEDGVEVGVDKGDEESDPDKNKKRGVIAGVGLASVATGAVSMKKGNAKDDDVDIDPVFSAEEGGNDESKSKKKFGLFSGGSRKSPKNRGSVDEDDDDNNKSPKNKSFFSRLSPKNRSSGEDGFEEGAFPTSPTTSADAACDDKGAQEVDLSAIVEEEQDGEDDDGKKGVHDSTVALVGLGAAVTAVAAASQGGSNENGSEGINVVPSDEGVEAMDRGGVFESSANAAMETPITEVGEKALAGDIAEVEDDDPLCPTDDENEALERDADQSFDKAAGEEKKAGGLLERLGRKAAETVVEVSETMSVGVGPDGKRVKTITTTKLMSNGVKTIKTRVEPIV